MMSNDEKLQAYDEECCAGERGKSRLVTSPEKVAFSTSDEELTPVPLHLNDEQ